MTVVVWAAVKLGCTRILVLWIQDFGKAVGSGELSTENVENLIVKEKLVNMGLLGTCIITLLVRVE